MRFTKQIVAVAVAAALVSGGAFYSVSGSNVRTPQQVCAAGIADLRIEVHPEGATVLECNPNANGFLEVPPTYDDTPVWEIAENAFKDCTELTGVYLPRSIEVIGQGAFFGAHSLRSVEIPGTVVEIPPNCFADCPCLTEVSIADGTRKIGDNAFSGATNLQAIVLPSTVEYIGRNAFMGCDMLHTLEIQNPDCLLNDLGCQPGCIRGHVGSTAERFANGNNIPFVAIEDVQTPEEPLFCDADGNGEISAMDAQYVLNYYSESIVGNNPSWREITGNPNAPE